MTNAFAGHSMESAGEIRLKRGRFAAELLGNINCTLLFAAPPHYAILALDRFPPPVDIFSDPNERSLQFTIRGNELGARADLPVRDQKPQHRPQRVSFQRSA
ncbi:MAG: hypothetical protein WA199_25065, partial [Xanthobacteraceae bacterium]